MTGIACDTLRDRMPDVASGGQRWSAADEAHLAECAACADEWRLVSTAATLGRDVAARLDPERLAAAVVARHRDEVRVLTFRRRASWAAGIVAVAAALVLVFGGLLPDGSEEPVQVAQATLVPELDGLEEGELQVVLDGLADPTVEFLYDPGSGTYDELEAGDLEDVLQAWEG